MQVLALFGPTAVGKTAIAIAIAERLRKTGEDPVAVSCDALQVYRGLETVTGAPTVHQRRLLEHRLVGVTELSDEFSAGRFAELARAEIDSLLGAGRRPLVVGGTGLYMRAALAELDLQPPVPPEVRTGVEADMRARGAASLHAELEPDVAARVHPNDRKRISRALELQRLGHDPPERGRELWTATLRHQTLLGAIVISHEELVNRIDSRVEAMLAAGAGQEARVADEGDISRTARAALGFDDLIKGDGEAVKQAHRAYAKRQLTWLRKMPGTAIVDRTGRDDASVADELVERLRA
jgi:tRNA dimethylallyltransferase